MQNQNRRAHSFALIPAELQALPQWVVWIYVKQAAGKKPTKVPLQPNGLNASVTDPTTWCTFEEACDVFELGGGDGIGFVFSPEDPYTGIDLDGTNDPGQLGFQRAIFESVPGYAEHSPSGDGLHIIARANLRGPGKRRGAVEMYSQARFFTMTGKVFRNDPIVDAQAAVDRFYFELGGTDPSAPAAPTGPAQQLPSIEDQQLYERARNAANGPRFQALWEGKYVDLGYPSQSEADFALIDILGFYTSDIQQVARLFRLSALGQRDKAKRDDYVLGMAKKSADRRPPPVELVNLDAAAPKKAEPAATGCNSGSSAQPNVAAVPAQEPEKVSAGSAAINTDNLPAVNPWAQQLPGAMHELATFMYYSSYRSQPEYANAAAFALMAGICGRAWNTHTGTGLNSYFLLIGNTSSGKDSVNAGISSVIAALSRTNSFMGSTIPSAVEFKGPSSIASGPAITSFLSKHNSKSVIAMLDEFGGPLRQWINPKSPPSVIDTADKLLRLYMLSGQGRSYDREIYAKAEDSKQAIRSPALSLIGTTTPGIYDAIDEAMIATGLLPRFHIIDCPREAGPRNAAQTMPQYELLNRMAYIAFTALNLNQTDKVLTVNYAQGERELFEDFEDECLRHQHNAPEHVRHLWSRAPLRALKLACLLAIYDNPQSTFLTAKFFDWAKRAVSYEVENLLRKFQRGEMGRGESDSSRQQEDVSRAIKSYFDRRSDPKFKAHFGVDPRMASAGVIPYSVIHKHAKFASLRNDRLGHTGALKKVLTDLVQQGVLEIFNEKTIRPEDWKKFKSDFNVRAGEFYLCADPERLK